MAEKKYYNPPTIEVVEPDTGGNTGLPFGLCKKYGIETGKDWTPRDAWNALKGKLGVDPEDVYKELDDKKKEKTPKLSSKEEINTWAKQKSITIQDNLFKKIPEETAVNQVSKFIDLYEKFPTKRNGMMYFDADKLSYLEVAKAEYAASTDNLGIKLNIDIFTKDYEQQVSDNVKIGWWGNIPKDNYKYYSVSHEYGHLIEYSIISQKDFNKKLRDKIPQVIARYGYNRTAIKKAMQKEGDALRKELFYDEIFPQIFAKAKEYDPSISVPKSITSTGYKTAPNVSGYAAKNWAEYFAESFAVGVLGGDNPIGKATVDIVKNYFGEKK